MVVMENFVVSAAGAPPARKQDFVVARLDWVVDIRAFAHPLDQQLLFRESRLLQASNRRGQRFRCYELHPSSCALKR